MAAKAEFGAVMTAGNASTHSLTAAGQITFRPQQWVILGEGAFLRNEAEGAVSAKSFAARGRASRVLTPRLQVFGERAYMRDLFSGVEHRNNTEAGLSYLLVQPGRHFLSADAGVGYMKEQRTNDDPLSTATATTAGRYRFQLSETSNITDDLLLTLDLSEEGTWRLNHTVALTAAVAAPLALKVSNVIRYVHEPVPGFQRSDTITSASLVMSF